MTLPVALDTNVLVRLLVNDDAAQAEQAAVLIDASPACSFAGLTSCLLRRALEWHRQGMDFPMRFTSPAARAVGP